VVEGAKSTVHSKRRAIAPPSKRRLPSAHRSPFHFECGPDPRVLPWLEVRAVTPAGPRSARPRETAALTLAVSLPGAIVFLNDGRAPSRAVELARPLLRHARSCAVALLGLFPLPIILLVLCLKKSGRDKASLNANIHRRTAPFGDFVLLHSVIRYLLVDCAPRSTSTAEPRPNRFVVGKIRKGAVGDSGADDEPNYDHNGL
jgi:hypothetical protein